MCRAFSNHSSKCVDQLKIMDNRMKVITTMPRVNQQVIRQLLFHSRYQSFIFASVSIRSTYFHSDVKTPSVVPISSLIKPPKKRFAKIVDSSANPKVKSNRDLMSLVNAVRSKTASLQEDLCKIDRISSKTLAKCQNVIDFKSIVKSVEKIQMEQRKIGNFLSDTYERDRQTFANICEKINEMDETLNLQREFNNRLMEVIKRNEDERKELRKVEEKFNELCEEFKHNEKQKKLNNLLIISIIALVWLVDSTLKWEVFPFFKITRATAK